MNLPYALDLICRDFANLLAEFVNLVCLGIRDETHASGFQASLGALTSFQDSELGKCCRFGNVFAADISSSDTLECINDSL